jgi:hypothetical protein
LAATIELVPLGIFFQVIILNHRVDQEKGSHPDSVQSHLMNARRQAHRVKGSKSLERNSDKSNAIRASNHLLEQIPARED